MRGNANLLSLLFPLAYATILSVLINGAETRVRHEPKFQGQPVHHVDFDRSTSTVILWKQLPLGKPDAGHRQYQPITFVSLKAKYRQVAVRVDLGLPIVSVLQKTDPGSSEHGREACSAGPAGAANRRVVAARLR